MTGSRQRNMWGRAITVLTVVLVAAGLSVPSPVGTSPQAAAASRAQAAANGTANAQAKAAKTGEKVEVLALRGERSTTVANPDGTFTTTEYVQPVRTRKSGMWTDIDTTLVRRDNATYAPKAALASMSFSGGGGTTLAEIERDGQSFSLDWPGTLPKPLIDGPTATYPDVLPGVDLKVTASAEGFSHVLVVKNAEAAENPDLAGLELPVDTGSLTLRKTKDGGLEARDGSSGATIFEAPAPMMWDSRPSAQSSAAPSASPAPSPSGLGPGDAVAPPDGSQVADVTVEVSEDTMTLRPDAGLLTGEDTVYPVYIDPVVRTSNRTGWTMVSSYYASTKFWKFDDDEGVGRCPADVSYRCTSNSDVKRQFFALPTGTFEDKDIVSAEFAVTMVHTYSESGREVQLGRVNSTGASAISSSTSWNNQPSLKDAITAQSPTNPAGSCTSTNQNVRFNVKGTIQKAADSGWDTTTFRLKAGDEGNYSYWKRFCGNAHLEVTYNRPPLQPDLDDLKMTPGGACEYGNAAEHYVSEPPKLIAALKDLDHGDTGSNSETLKAQFHIFWRVGSTTYDRYATTAPKSTVDMSRSGQTGVASFSYVAGTDLSGDGEAGFTVPQNVTIGWAVRGYDGTSWGPWSLAGAGTRCEFIYDATAPKAPAIRSAQYPNDDAWHAGVGDYGSFTFDSASADAVQYKYRFKGSTWVTVKPNTAGGPATVRWMPPDEGPMYVEAKAVDNAGNAQKTPTSYVFLVSDGRAPAAGWTLGDAKGSTSAAGMSGAPEAIPGSGVAFGDEGPLGPTDTAVSLDGSDNAYLDAGRSAVDTSRTFSVSAWVNLPERPTDDVTIVSQDGTAEPGFDLGYDVDTQSWTFRTPVSDLETMGTWKVSGATAVPGSWTHLIGVYNSELGTLSLFVNGDLVEKDVEKRRTTWNATGGLQIGRKLSLDGYTGHFKGRVADVKVHDRVVPEAEGAELGGVSASQLAYWQVDSATDGLTPETAGGTGLALGGGASVFQPDDSCDPEADPDCVPPAEPLWGDGHLALNGTDAYAARAAGLLAKEDSFTLTARARLAGAGASKDQTVLSLAGTSGSAVTVKYSAAADRWQLAVTNKDAATATTTAATAGGVLPSGEGDGDHLAVVYSAVFGDVLLYVNGTRAAQARWDNAWDFTTVSLQVGRSLTARAASAYFAGAVDELRIYRGALDASTVPTVAVLPAGSSIDETVT
ncbi:LamG-like jellyroll fold domain-containing protein [Streptomyces botrytidirepellens]|uniref:DNRLRE domain-containing protein n=1 Tax=Streptomyces botrytidirepellens TaxID=2486417 RepID=A0A3M8VWR3_9ACTN|nr:LamG-like jellyroll fold domain-containing protein [Streptomyces botrytidirepellens]RNG22322.1 DNRLRE domain-containing protein [Streptomyces botrytidirepellens]